MGRADRFPQHAGNPTEDALFMVRATFSLSLQNRSIVLLGAFLTAVSGLPHATPASPIGSQAQKPPAIVGVTGMLVRLFPTPDLTLLSDCFFPAPKGQGGRQHDLIAGTDPTDEILRDATADAVRGPGDGPDRKLEGS
jgi:hypothetical protein